MSFIAPQGPLRWDHSEADIKNLTNLAIEKYRTVLDAVGALDARDCNFHTVTLAQGHTSFRAIAGPMAFYQDVSPTQEIRDASTDAESLVRDFEVELSMRLDVFNSKVAAEKNLKESGRWDKLIPEELRLVEKMILDGTRSGLGLPVEGREELTNLKKELSQACLDFEKNVNEENGHITFFEEELAGVPKYIVSGYTKRTEAGKDVYDVKLKNTDFGPILQFSEDPEVRQRVYESHESRLEVNVPIFAKIMELRRKVAGLLGYKNWADYITEVKMVKSGKAAEDFLDDLVEKLLPIGIKDCENHLAIKKKEHETKGLPFDGKYNLWDESYYSRKYVKETLDLDGTLVREYFPVSHVVPVILEIYQNLLSVRFEEIKEASVWHPDVQAYAVWEKDAKDEAGFIGYAYFDLLPRAGKYPNLMVCPLLLGYDLPDGKRSYPSCAIVANLAKPTPEKPALLGHFDTVNLFHEVGHIFHELLSKTKFSRFHGTTVALDFGEAPSQMLENWCYEPKVLERITSHYETKKPMSPDLIEKLLKNRYMNFGLFNLRQLFLAKYDIKVHIDQNIEDYTHFWCSLRKKMTLLDHDKECPGQSAFSHLINYDAGYYGYMYSNVFAADMYATVFKADPLDPIRGKLYRDKILLPGSSRDELDILQDFLGRPPNSEAYLKQLFGTGPASTTTQTVDDKS
ncbi:hypothetical protein GALMADRAFT_273237 [Galerina marginata CBS 339.88]|uniref:Peptidase M3A/M3B catalytic domain-containing protein n=1 Tax=Galerina marginata (strain CBS 339.88) TaxID=685588 RepID=A0A067SBZ0_GALM3|nr:hypothetical protein GALMADRAFT_273237 [Galerina marginata CBS 339.88]